MRSLVLVNAIAFGLICSQSIHAQDAATDSPTLWVHAGTLLDQPGKPPRAESWIGIDSQSGIITAIVSKRPEMAANATVIDLSKQFVMPGLIDCHVHLLSDKAGIEGQLEEVTQSLPAGAYQAMINGQKTVAAGFTTVRNLGDGSGVTLALRDAINSGSIIGPMILDAGQPISVTAGHMDGRLGFAPHLQPAVSQGENLCDGADSCRRTVRGQIARGVDVIKIATTGGVNSRVGAGLGQQMFEDEARAIVETAHLAGKKVAVHAHGADGVALAVKVGADSIEHGTLLDEAGMRQMRKSGSYLVATMSTINGYKARLAANPNAYDALVKPKIMWRLEVTGKSFRKALENGVKIAFGTDAGVSMHGRNADEFELMIEHGMTPTQAIVAATTNAANLLGVQDRVGQLKVGMQADLIAVDGDPLKDVRVLKQMHTVMRKGEVVHTQAQPLLRDMAPK
jgi:imidazolonepropionase-like amidohydrolase